MENEDLIKDWFLKWEQGDFKNIPVSDNFTHTSPFGTIEGKHEYLKIVEANKKAFLGGKFKIHDTLVKDNRGSVRYTMQSGDHSMEVSEWFYFAKGKISQIITYYNIGNVSQDDLNSPSD